MRVRVSESECERERASKQGTQSRRKCHSSHSKRSHKTSEINREQKRNSNSAANKAFDEEDAGSGSVERVSE